MTVNTQEAGDAPPGALKTMVTDVPPAFSGRTLRTGPDSNGEGALGRPKFESQLGLLLTGSVASGRSCNTSGPQFHHLSSEDINIFLPPRIIRITGFKGNL